MIIINTKNPIGIILFKKNHKITCDVFAINLGGIPIKIEKEEAVVAYYYYTISNDFIIKDCFIPIQDLPDRSIHYFDYIKRQYVLEDRICGFESGK